MKYIDRSGTIYEADTDQDRLLASLYNHAAGRVVLKLLTRPALSKLGGKLLESRISALFAAPFARSHGIDLSQYQTDHFKSYNDFFTRQIKPEYRPINQEEHILISPCDGKLSVYPIDQNSRFTIKHTSYTVESLLRFPKLAKRYQGGYACIFRLTVDDYHRYCYMANGRKSDNIRIPGILHTVNPVANDIYPIYKENTREYCLLKTRSFGTLLIMEVGALMVGRITNYHESCTVKKGQEKGRFEFGGSTIIVLLQKHRARIDQDLLENTKAGYETIIKMGAPIATSVSVQLQSPTP